MKQSGTHKKCIESRPNSCFFCRKKCYSKERFFSHFRVHFGRTSNGKLSNGKRRHSVANANCDEASDEGSEDEIRDGEKFISLLALSGAKPTGLKMFFRLNK